VSSNRVTEDGAKFIASMLADPGCRLRNLFISGPLETTKDLERQRKMEEEETRRRGNLSRAQSIDEEEAESGASGAGGAGTHAVLTAKRLLSRKNGRIGFMGAVYISTALLAPHGCPLRNLTMVNCDIGPMTEGVKSLAVALYGNDELQTLNLCDNKLGEKGAEVSERSEQALRKTRATAKLTFLCYPTQLHFGLLTPLPPCSITNAPRTFFALCRFCKRLSR